MLGISFTPSPKNFIPFIVSGRSQSIKNQQENRVTMIEIIFPVFSADWTWASLASLFFTLINNVPIIEAIIPTPAINSGSKIGPIPLNASENCSDEKSDMSLIM